MSSSPYKSMYMIPESSYKLLTESQDKITKSVMGSHSLRQLNNISVMDGGRVTVRTDEHTKVLPVPTQVVNPEQSDTKKISHFDNSAMMAKTHGGGNDENFTEESPNTDINTITSPPDRTFKKPNTADIQPRIPSRTSAYTMTNPISQSTIGLNTDPPENKDTSTSDLIDQADAQTNTSVEKRDFGSTANLIKSQNIDTDTSDLIKKADAETSSENLVSKNDVSTSFPEKSSLSTSTEKIHTADAQVGPPPLQSTTSMTDEVVKKDVQAGPPPLQSTSSMTDDVVKKDAQVGPPPLQSTASMTDDIVKKDTQVDPPPSQPVVPMIEEEKEEEKKSSLDDTVRNISNDRGYWMESPNADPAVEEKPEANIWSHRLRSRIKSRKPYSREKSSKTSDELENLLSKKSRLAKKMEGTEWTEFLNSDPTMYKPETGESTSLQERNEKTDKSTQMEAIFGDIDDIDDSDEEMREDPENENKEKDSLPPRQKKEEKLVSRGQKRTKTEEDEKEDTSIALGRQSKKMEPPPSKTRRQLSAKKKEEPEETLDTSQKLSKKSKSPSHKKTAQVPVKKKRLLKVEADQNLTQRRSRRINKLPAKKKGLIKVKATQDEDPDEIKDIKDIKII